jgi:glucose/arabinose dehydrogenase
MWRDMRMRVKKFFLHSFIGLYVICFLQSCAEKDLPAQNLKIEKGFKLEVFASDISSPRQLAQGDDQRIYVGSKKEGKIFALRDTDGNGVADEKILVAENLFLATGVSFFNGDLFFSEISKIWKIENISEAMDLRPDELPQKILVTDNLPSDEWHGWKWLKHDEGGMLYTNVGAPCNVCLSQDKRHASILRLNNNTWEYVARGVRNSVGFDFHPISKKLYFGDNGRDWLGDDSPSCELNRVDVEGAFYGFPYKHANSIIDPEFGALNPGYDFIDPILNLGAHVAPTGIAFYSGDMFPSEFQNNLFITLHGSWNRSEKVGYKVIRVILDNDGNVIESKDFISGWLDVETVPGEPNVETVLGRPSAPLIMSDGSLLISDDKANVIYRVTHS